MEIMLLNSYLCDVTYFLCFSSREFDYNLLLYFVVLLKRIITFDFFCLSSIFSTIKVLD